MAVSPGLSGIIASIVSLVLMASMQIFKSYLISSKLSTLFAGFLGSILFLFVLTAISNFEMATFGKHFQSKYGEVIISLIITLFAVGLVHRVAVTVCILCSIVALYFLNRISAKAYQTNTTAQSHFVLKNSSSKKRKN